MSVSSWADSLDQLKSDLTAHPMRIAAHQDMPFAIFRYAPSDEFLLRKQLRLMAITLQQEHGRKVTFVSLSRLVWNAVQTHGGTDYLYKTESTRGFHAAQQHVNHLLTSPDFQPASDALLLAMAALNPDKDMVFLVRAGGFAPGIFRVSVLLDGLHRQTKVPVILFYPGSARVGTDLRFYDIPADGNLGVYNYRVRVYGAES
jgi:hypothetical protein